VTFDVTGIHSYQVRTRARSRLSRRRRLADRRERDGDTGQADPLGATNDSATSTLLPPHDDGLARHGHPLLHAELRPDARPRRASLRPGRFRRLQQLDLDGRQLAVRAEVRVERADSIERVLPDRPEPDDHAHQRRIHFGVHRHSSLLRRCGADRGSYAPPRLVSGRTRVEPGRVVDHFDDLAVRPGGRLAGGGRGEPGFQDPIPDHGQLIAPAREGRLRPNRGDRPATGSFTANARVSLVDPSNSSRCSSRTARRTRIRTR